MEREKLRELYNAIKSDDVRLFTSLMLSRSDLNISFGRFPLLSLCYLFNAVSILNIYERYLMPINKFEIVPEYFEIYKEFKMHAKKSLRLFADKSRVVYPIEMLAILDERKLIANKYKFLFKNEEILNNVQKIYNLNQEIEIKATRENFECKQKKLNLKQKIIVCAMSFVLCFMSVFSVVSVSWVNSFGKGTKDSPIYISNESEFKTAIKLDGKYYVLKNDIVLSNDISVSSFAGTIDGAGYSVKLKNNSASSMIGKLSGTIQNLNIEFELENFIFDSNYSVLTQNNTGTIKNCSFSGKINGLFNSTEDAYVSVVAHENNGTIENVVVDLNSNVSNKGQTNAFVSAVSGINNATIKDAKTLSGKIVADTVDLAGIVAENYGTIENVSNNIELEQTSNKSWNPNSSGIVIVNNSAVKNATNNAKITSTSTTETLPDDNSELHSLAAGIACNNNFLIETCTNKGIIKANGNVAVGLAGGVVCENTYYVKDCKNEANVSASSQTSVSIAGGIACRNLIASVNGVVSYYSLVSNSISKCDIESFSDKGTVYAGGVVAWNNSEVEDSGFVGKITANTNKEGSIAVYAGGVVGLNNECKLANNYASVEFVNKPAYDENNLKLYGAIAGYVGAAKTYYDYSSGQSEMVLGNGYRYVATNRYVKNETIEYAAVGQVVNLVYALNNPFFPINQTMGFEKLLKDAGKLYYIEYATLEELLSEVNVSEEVVL